MGVLAILIAVALAFANGANDNGKGVATLVGGRVLRLWPAIVYAAVTTLAGSITAIWIGAELIRKFKGKGVVGDGLLADPVFAISMAFGAALTVLLATRLSLPISTTHAMVGAIIGIGVAANDLFVQAVWSGFFFPLLASPVIAMGSAVMLYLLFRGVRVACGIQPETCLCVGRTVEPVTYMPDGQPVLASSKVQLSVDQTENCQRRYVGRFFGVDAQRVLDGAHVLSAGALSFARGLNDTPKIAAVMLAATAANASLGVGRVGAVSSTGLAILVGGLLAVRRVAQTVSYRITDMNDGQAFSANLNAAILVIFASRLGVPVSTTHVTCGSLFGIGAANGKAHGGMILRIVAAWVTTLPMAAAVGALAWLAFGALFRA